MMMMIVGDDKNKMVSWMREKRVAQGNNDRSCS